jgi:putative phosphoribosyl transferase
MSPTPIEIPADNTVLSGMLEIPANAKSIIVFAHGLDSSNLSPRNRLVARSLLQRGFAVLLPNLTEQAASPPAIDPPHGQSGILKTATRLVAIIDWLAANPATSGLRIGLFGACTGAAAVMIATALRPNNVCSVVSRGGRPDLADDLLPKVQAPTLMLVGSNDKAVIDHNRKAGERMRRKPMLELIQGATHLFGEPGKLEQVASISYLWFRQTLARCG